MSLSLPIGASFHVLLWSRDGRLRKTVGPAIYTEGGDWIRSRVIRYTRGDSTCDLMCGPIVETFSINYFFIERSVFVGHSNSCLRQHQAWCICSIQIKQSHFQFSCRYLLTGEKSFTKSFKLSLYWLKYFVTSMRFEILKCMYIKISHFFLVILVYAGRYIKQNVKRIQNVKQNTLHFMNILKRLVSILITNPCFSAKKLSLGCSK